MVEFVSFIPNSCMELNEVTVSDVVQSHCQLIINHLGGCMYFSNKTQLSTSLLFLLISSYLYVLINGCYPLELYCV